jgi:hypothetical protein
MLAMDRRALLQAMGAAAVVPLAGGAELEAQTVDKETVYELRIYHVAEGKLDALLARFRGPERPIFEKHGMHCVAFWTPTDDPVKGHEFIYIVRHKSRAIADQNWKAFQTDPEWVKLKAETEANGPLVEKHDVMFMSLTDFSPVL